MGELTFVQKITVWALPILFAITVHEAAHGWVAKKLGDKTAMMLGRVTLNPIKHIDPIGTILLPLIALLMTNFVFGWAKPVPVTWENLKNPKRDMALVALAGPFANILMALFWGIVMKIALSLGPDWYWLGTPLSLMGAAGIFINVILCVLNLLPLPPLDGGRILTAVLPGPLAWQVSRLEPYGLFILIALLVTGVLGRILGPPIMFLQNGIYSLFT